MNKHDGTIVGLQGLGLTPKEAQVYLELLRKPATHAKISQTTGINRTTIYRLVHALERRGLVSHRIDDTGRYLIAADPATLEAGVVTEETRVKRQRKMLDQLLPALEGIKKGYEADFAVHTYEGEQGFKRMLWHELKTQGDCLCIGFGALEDLVLSRTWAEKHRQRTVEAGYRIREIANRESTPLYFTRSDDFLQNYERRVISRSVLPINHLITVYNNTVATYHVYEGRRIGLEIESKQYAETIRSIFEMYWRIGEIL